jgi:CubicO group peptidase (beta-lactamase class C family)
MTEIHGYTAPGFERVREAFAGNFATQNEVGAAFSAYQHGEKVVDLWGGVAEADTGRPWEEDAIVLVFSTTKGATALCANRLVDQGLLDMDAPVADYWPEFAQAGKGDIPVNYLLSHRSGLAWVDDVMTLEEALGWEPVIDALERQAPVWEPGSQHGYHATTYGWLVGEVVRRISGKSLGTFFRDEVADPLGLDFWIGLPAEQEDRVVPLITIPTPEAGPMKELMDAFMGPETMLGKSLNAPGGAFSPDGNLAGVDVFNTRDVRAAEIPAANGVTDARSLARMYASMLGEVDGIRTLSAGQLKAATTQQTSGPNVVLAGLDVQFGLGFMLPSSIMPMRGPNSFGHFGMGGSVGWGDPDAELGFGYVMNKMDLGVVGDPRSSNLINAVYDSL